MDRKGGGTKIILTLGVLKNQSMYEKPTFEKYLQSFTPFYVNHDFDRQVLDTVNQEVEKYRHLIHQLDSYAGIEKFISEHPDSLRIILSLIDLSGERFKRIVTTIRIGRGDIVSTEWDEVKIRKEIIADVAFRRVIIGLFIDGSKSEIGSQLPSYYLENVSLQSSAIAKLSDTFYLKRILKKVGDGKYNNSVGDKVEDLIAAELDKLGRKYGVTYSREKFVTWIDRNMDFCIPNEHDPYVILESSFQVTTGSGQTTKRVDELKAAAEIRNHNIQKGKNIAFVNLCDGAGWIGRQADLRRIYQASDYMLTINTINRLEDIILRHVPDKYLPGK
ncbi:DpnII restriction endonuclease [compost metagenome]